MAASSSTSKMAGIVIIGAGECGTRAAFAARAEGYEGPIALIGDEPCLPYERPPLSKPDATGEVEKAITSLATLSENAITLKSGVAVVAIKPGDCTVLLSDGASLSYDRLLIATGARPRLMNCRGGSQMASLRTISDARAIYSKAKTASNIVIVGAGLIGLELAAELSGRGTRVTVLEAGPRPLGRNVPERLATKLMKRHRNEGVELLFDSSIVACDGNSLTLVDGRTFEADLVIAAIGVEPNEELAKSAGLTVQNGVRVNERLETDDPRIFAAGDCASVLASDGTYRRYETWQNAQMQGEIAGVNLAGGDARFDQPVWFWSDQYDMGLQGVGNTSGTPTAVREVGEDEELLFFLDASNRLVGAAGLGQGNAVAKDIKIAQRLIGTTIDPTLLADPTHNLKKLLRTI